MTSFIDLRASKGLFSLPNVYLFLFLVKPNITKENASYNKIIGSGIGGIGSSRFVPEKQSGSDISFNKNTFGSRTLGQNQQSEITRKIQTSNIFKF